MKYKLNGQWVDINIKALDSMPIGAIIQFAGDVIPNGWLVCDGSSLNKTTYAELFTAIGTKYGGSGNNFNLPNFKGKVAVGQDTSQTEFDTLGETGGSKYLQEHNHLNGVYTDTNWTIAPVSGQRVGVPIVYNSNMYTSNAGTGNSGNLQPYLVVNYIIKVMNTVPVMATVTNTKNSSTDNVYSCNYVNEKLDPFDTKSFGLSGYQKLPSGLIIQWGQKEVTRTSLEQTYTATFPTTFPNNCFNVVACLNDAGWGSNKMNEQVATSTWSTSNVTFSIKAIDQYQEHTLSIRYFAIGN